MLRPIRDKPADTDARGGDADDAHATPHGHNAELPRASGTVIGLAGASSFEPSEREDANDPEPAVRPMRRSRRLAAAKKEARLAMLRDEPKAERDEPDVTPLPRSVPAKLFRAFTQTALMLGVLVGAFVIMQMMIAAKPERERRERPETVYTIETVEAVAADNRPTLNLYGEVVTGRAIDMRAPVAGEIVRVDPGLREGLRVSAGQELAAIDDFDARAALTDARAALAQAQGNIRETEARIDAEEAQVAASEDQLALTRADFERTQGLVERGTTPAAQLDVKRLALSQSEQALLTRRANLAVQRAQLDTQSSQIERLELNVERAERTLADTVMTAPFAGVVRSADAEIGRTVTPNDVLVSLYDDGALEARFQLTDAQYGRLATDRDPLIGRPATVTWTVGGEAYAYGATVTRLGAEIATERGGVELFAVIEPEQGAVALRPGAFVEIALPDRTFANTFRLPETALYDERDVYVDANGQLERRGVERLAFDGEDVIVRGSAQSGLAEGERVMATRISRVDAGLRVRERGSERPVAPQRGPSDEVLAEVAAANDISVEDLRAMPRDERRAMIRAYREANGSSEDGPGGGRGVRRATGG